MSTLCAPVTLRKPFWALILAGLMALGLAACGSDADDNPPAALPNSLTVLAPAQAEPGSPVSFGSSAGDTAGLSYRWDFGDGITSSEAAPRHSYALPGTYRVRLLLSNRIGETLASETSLRVGRYGALADAACAQPDRSGWCQQWPLDASREITLLHDRAGQRAHGAGSDGRLYLAEGSGGDWQEARLDTPARRIDRMAFADADTGWALGLTAGPEQLPGSTAPARAPLLLKTVDGGRQWTRLALPDAAAVALLQTQDTRLEVLDRQHLILSHEASRSRWVSRDGGLQWTATPWWTGLIRPRQGHTLWLLTSEAGGAEAVVHRSLDLGLSFQEVLRRPTGEGFAALGFADDLRGWLMYTERGPGSFELRERFVTTRDGGDQWAELGGTGLARRPVQALPPTVTWLDASHAIASNTSCGMFRVMDFYRSVDGGLSWSPIAKPAAAAFLHDLVPVAGSATTAWTSGRQGCGMPAPDAGTPVLRRALLTRDLGQTWQTVEVDMEAPGSPVQAVRLAADQSLLLDYPGRTYRSADGGQTWSRLWPAPTSQFEAVDGRHALAFGSPTQGFAVSASGRLLTSSNGGRSWVPEGLVVSDGIGGSAERQAMNLRGRIQVLADSSAWVTGVHGIHRLLDGRVDGQPRVVAADGRAARDLHFVDARRGWVLQSSPHDPSDPTAFLGTPPLLWATADGGETWQEQARFDFQALGLHFANGQLGLVVGTGGAILRSTDGGATWTRQPSGTTGALHRVRFADATTAWAVGAPGAGVLVSRDGGLSWQPVAVGSPHAWNGLFFLDAQRGWIVGDFGQIASTRDGGRSWALQASNTSDHLFDLSATDAETAWVIGERGVIRATATGGD